MAYPPPYALAQVSVNGATPVTGGVTVSNGDTIQLSAASSVGWTQQRWEIYDYPEGFEAPIGWSTDDDGVIYSTSVTPFWFAMPSPGSSVWGKWLIRLRINQGMSNNSASPQYVDESLIIDLVSPRGLHALGAGETRQFSTRQGWALHQNANWKQIDTQLAVLAAGGGGGESSVARSARVVLTAPVTASGVPGSPVDGITLTAGDRVLRTADGTENGVWVVASGTWERASDMAASATLQPGTVVHVTEGVVYRQTEWYLSNTSSVTVGATAQSWTLRYSADAARFNVRADGVEKIDGAITIVSSKGHLTSASTTFTARDVGKACLVWSESGALTGTVSLSRPEDNPLSGTVSIAAGVEDEEFSVMTGSGCSFTTQLVATDRFTVGSQTFVCISITNDNLAHCTRVESPVSGTAYKRVATITGVGTDFTQFAPHQWICIGGIPYRWCTIASATSGTVCTTGYTEPYVTVSGAAWYRYPATLTTIDGYVGAHEVTLAAVGQPGTGRRFFYGTDNTLALQAIIDSCQAQKNVVTFAGASHGGGARSATPTGLVLYAGNLHINEKTGLEIEGAEADVSSALVGLAASGDLIAIGSSQHIKLRKLYLRAVNPAFSDWIVSIQNRHHHPDGLSTSVSDPGYIEINDCAFDGIFTGARGINCDASVIVEVNRPIFIGLKEPATLVFDGGQYANAGVIRAPKFSGCFGGIKNLYQAWSVEGAVLEPFLCSHKPWFEHASGISVGLAGQTGVEARGSWCGDVAPSLARTLAVDESGEPYSWFEVAGSGVHIHSNFAATSGPSGSYGLRIKAVENVDTAGVMVDANVLPSVLIDDDATASALAFIANSLGEGIVGPMSGHGYVQLANRSTSGTIPQIISGVGCLFGGAIREEEMPRYLAVGIGDILAVPRRLSWSFDTCKVGLLWAATGEVSGSLGLFADPSALGATVSIWATSPTAAVGDPSVKVAEFGTVGYRLGSGTLGAPPTVTTPASLVSGLVARGVLSGSSTVSQFYSPTRGANLTDATAIVSVSDGVERMMPAGVQTAAQDVNLDSSGAGVDNNTIVIIQAGNGFTLNVYDLGTTTLLYSFPVTTPRAASFHWSGTAWVLVSTMAISIA